MSAPRYRGDSPREMTSAELDEETRGPWRAYDTVTEWSGPVRRTIEAAEKDADRHNRGCEQQGGFGSAQVVTRDPESRSRLVDLRGKSVWPPHGRSTGAARWVQS